MAKKKKKFAYKGKVMSAARRIWLHSPLRREALKRNKTPDGFHRCERCRKLTDTVHLDHEPPVVPLEGWDSWDAVFERLFCPSEQLRILCVPCHNKKSLNETKIRKEHRAAKLGKKKENE